MKYRKRVYFLFINERVFMEKRLMMVLASLFLCIGGLFAQTRVTGTVISQDDGEPVIGATIRVSGTNEGTVTDSNGSFTITCPEGKKVLVISYVGMEPVEVVAKSNMRIVLRSGDTNLD